MDYDVGIVRRRRIISADECFFGTPLPLGGWTPLLLPGLLAWYKADVGVTTSSGNVTQVLDQSPNGNTLTNSGTVPFSATGFNGFACFNFLNANNAILQTSTTSVVMGTGTVGSVFVCGQLLTNAMSNSRIVSYLRSGDANDFSTATSAAWLIRDLNNNGIAAYRNNSGQESANDTVTLGNNYRLGTIYDGANLTTYVNNVAGTGFADTNAWGSPGQLGIGNTPGLGAAYEGPIAEVVATNSALGASDRLLLDTYFKGRFNL